MITKLESCYYAKCQETGEVFESSDCKSLYYALRSFFRSEVGQNEYYSRRSAIIRRGVHSEEQYPDGSLHGSYNSYAALSYMCVTCVDGVTKVYFEDWRTV